MTRTEELEVALLTPPERRRLADDVVERLRDLIVRGVLTPGQPLREEALARSLAVSRGPVREALSQLEREGLVLRQPNRVASVARLTRDDLEEVYTLRTALERLAAVHAVRNLTDEGLSRLDEVIEEMEQAVRKGLTEQEAATLDLRFHDILYEESRHKRLAEVWANLRPQVLVLLLARNAANPDFREYTVRLHREIVDALRRRDPDLAARVIEDHIRVAYDRIVATYVEGS